MIPATVLASSSQSYAHDIIATWQPVLDAAPDLVAAILATGRRLLDVKADLPHGSWLQLFRHGAACAEGCSHVKQPVPFGVNMAGKLMRVARHPALQSGNTLPLLPADVLTLSTLASLPPAVLTKALADGTVHPAMRREDVRALKPPRANPSATPWRLQDALTYLRTHIAAVDGTWPPTESLTPLVNELRWRADIFEKEEVRRARA